MTDINVASIRFFQEYGKYTLPFMPMIMAYVDTVNAMLHLCLVPFTPMTPDHPRKKTIFS